MKSKYGKNALIVLMGLAVLACGQGEVILPDLGIPAFECGAWYPGGGAADAGLENVFGIEKNKIFPCLVWGSARLKSEDTYINIGEEYLKAKHGVTDNRSIVIVVSAEACPSCRTLINAMADRVLEFEEAGALMIGMARRNLQGAADDPDFSLGKADAVLKSEMWQTDKWYVINDNNRYLDKKFDEGTPWTIIVGMKDMVVRSVSNEEFSPDTTGVENLLKLIQSF